MEEKKLTDEAVNATAKSLKWVCNQIPNDLGNSNEEKMLKCIQLYCQQGIAVIERLQSENKELKSPKFASWKLKFFNLKEEFDKELSEHEEFTKKAKAEIERLTEYNANLNGMCLEFIDKNAELQKQVDELKAFKDEAISLSLYGVGLKDGKALAVKDTVKEIFAKVKAILNYLDNEWEISNALYPLEKEYGVEVE